MAVDSKKLEDFMPNTELEWSETAIPLVGLSADAREGAAAFREKRESDFKGV
jgi:1,4-dihydroxy-2-naphthoyl-CoA synthase